MKILKARYIRKGVPNGRALTFKSKENLLPGELIKYGQGKLIVVDEPIDEEWLKAYGEENIKEVSRLIESEEKENV